MAINKLKPTVTLGAKIKGTTIEKKIDEVIDVVNDLNDGTIESTTLELSGSLKTDTVSELTAAAGVTIDGVLLKDSQVKTDVIIEKTAANGVTIDGVLLKDGNLVTLAGATNDAIVTAADQANQDNTYTIPDIDADANFVMSEGAQTVNGAKTFGSAILSGVSLGSVGTGVTAQHFGDGKDITTVLTLTAVDLGAPTAGASEAVGALVYTFPAGVHVHTVTSFSVGLTIGTVQTDTPDVGVGSVIGTGAVATLDGTPTFEDYITGQSWSATLDGTAQAAGPLGATAGVLTGISLNKAADVKAFHLNAADGWDAGITGNLTADGTITFKWTVL